MDTPRTFLCTVMHPGLFPGPIIDLGRPLRVKMLVEVGTEDLIIRASAPIAKGKVMGTESLSKIGRVTIERVTGSAQRIEILRRSLWRMVLVGGIVLAYTLLFRSYPLRYDALMALAVAAFIGPLNFLLDGGLGRKPDVVRFHFMPTESGRPFYLEVLSAEQQELHEALLAAGLSPEDAEASQQTWTCGNCGAVVDAIAMTCPSVRHRV